MTTLASLARATPRTVSIEGGEIPVYPLTLGAIASLLARHPVLLAGFSAGVADPQVIVASILKSGNTAVCDLIDSATKSPEGTASEVGLTAFDEAEILVACIDATLPKDPERLEKFVAQLDALLTRLGLNEMKEATE